jgi:putative peptide zinc metalloprotease protein
MPADRPTFSQQWSRVARLTPTLRPQVQIHRQLYRGEPWHVVHDPVNNNFFRLNPVAYHLVGLLDGKRNVDDVWRLTLEKFGDSAPTQNEVIGLLGQLNQTNLLRVDLPADAAPLLARSRQRRLREWGGQLMSILSLRIPVFNPDKMLDWLLPFFRPFLNRYGLIAWFIFICIALWQIIPHFSEFSSNVDSVLAPENWGWMMIIFVVTKAWHELGHGIVCKKFGGRVPEVGIMLLVLLPAPYVDATSSWSFSDKWKRLMVGAAGMTFELILAGIAAIIWVNTDGQTLLKQLSYNAVVMASITTIMFNANPLLRFDGYYMLSDFFETPNLYQRAGKQICWLVQRYAFGLKNAQVVTTVPFEKWFFVLYGFASQIYKVFLMFSISLIVADRLFTIGILIAIWGIVSWACIPIGKFTHWLITSPSLHEHRLRAVAVTIAFVAIVGGSLGGIPAPDHRRAEGIIESTERTDVSMQSDGFVTQILVDTGNDVVKDQVLVIADNPDLKSHQQQLRAQLKQLQIELRGALAKAPVEAQATQYKIDSLNEKLANIDLRVDGLIIRAPQDGRFIGESLYKHLGAFVKRGQPLGQIDNLNSLRITALVDQSHNSSGFMGEISKVEVRSASDVTDLGATQIYRHLGGGITHLPHASLGYAGGGPIATDPSDKQGMTALRPQFVLWLKMPEKTDDPDTHQARPETAYYPGQRVHVRFTLAQHTPYLSQLIHRLRQIVGDRLSITV